MSEGDIAIAVQTSAQANKDDGSEQSVGEYILVFFAYIFLFLTFPLSLPTSLKVVHQYERAVIFRNGKVRPGLLLPGLVFVLPCIEELVTIDIRTKCYQTPFQQLLTNDAVSIKINAMVAVDVPTPRPLLVNRVPVQPAVIRRTLTTVREVCGLLTLMEIVQGRDKLSKTILKTIRRKWRGNIEFQRVEIKNIELPDNMQRVMASEALSTREGRAKVVLADGELRASRALKEAADIAATSPSFLQLRYLQTMQETAKEKNHSVILPFPTQLIPGGTKSQHTPAAKPKRDALPTKGTPLPNVNTPAHDSDVTDGTTPTRNTALGNVSAPNQNTAARDRRANTEHVTTVVVVNESGKEGHIKHA